MLADEPTGNLDRKNSQEIVELLKYSNRQYGQTLIVITHDESIALQADRVLAIEDGHIVRDEVIRKCMCFTVLRSAPCAQTACGRSSRSSA